MTTTNVTPTNRQILVEPIFVKSFISVEVPDSLDKELKEVDEPLDVFRVISWCPTLNGEEVSIPGNTHLIAKVFVADLCKTGSKHDKSLVFIDAANVLGYCSLEEELAEVNTENPGPVDGTPE